MKGLKMEHYDDIEDIIAEALEALCGITDVRYDISELEKDVEYVCGAICVVKLGDKPNTLRHRLHDGTWSEEVEKTNTNYVGATYYRVDEIQTLVEQRLTRKHYNNELLNLKE